MTGLILAALVVGGAACGDSTPTKSGGSPEAPAVTSSATTPVVIMGSGPCSLVTQDEAAEVYGSPVPASTERSFSFPVGDASLDEQVCMFGSEVLLARIDMGSAASTLFAQYKASLQGESDFEEVSGVGEEAFFAKGQLNVRQGNTGLIVDIGQNTGSVPGEQDKEKALAAIALGRL